MHLYFSTSQIPELRGLTARQHDLVEDLCLRPILLRTRVRIAKFAFLFSLFLLGAEVVPGLWPELWQKLALYTLAFLVLYAADQLFDVVVLVLNRRSIAEFVSSHEDELR